MRKNLINRTMQMPKQFDPETLQKIRKSALIALGGFLLIGVPFATEGLISYLQTGEMFDWVTLSVMGITAGSTWFVNTIREYLTGNK